MNIKINNTSDAKSDSLILLNGADSFESLVSTMRTIKISIQNNWSDCAAKTSAIDNLTSSIEYYENKIIPALNKLGTSVDAYALATEQLAASRASGGGVGVSTVSNTETAYGSPSEYVDSQRYSFDGYSSTRSIESVTDLQPGEIDAYLYGKAMDMGMTDEQAKMAIAIARTETGDYTSNRIVNDYNWGGIKGTSDVEAGITIDSDLFRHYSNADQGAEDFLSVLKGCYDKGCDSFADLQRTYCPDTDANGYSYWLNTTTAIYNERFVYNTRVMER